MNEKLGMWIAVLALAIAGMGFVFHEGLLLVAVFFMILSTVTLVLSKGEGEC